jgi:hypothetical protein
LFEKLKAQSGTAFKVKERLLTLKAVDPACNGFQLVEIGVLLVQRYSLPMLSVSRALCQLAFPSA